MTLLIELALGWGAPAWLAKLFGWAVPILLVAAAIWGGIAYLEHKGASTQKAADTAVAVQQHAQTVQQARTDEHAAQATADAIGQTVKATDDATTALVRSKIEDMHNAIDIAPVGAAPAVADTGSVSASLNDLIQRANGSADDADAEP